jgi:L-cystine transport system permease protein
MAIDLPFIGKTLLLTAEGIPVTLKLTVVTLLVSTPFAFAMAIVNLNPRRALSRIFRVYISFVRSIPILVIIFLLYYILPLALSDAIRVLGLDFDVYSLDDIVYGYIVFSFATIPSLSEVFRSGLMTVPKSQFEAAACVGMTQFQSYTRVILPQAVNAALPVLCTLVTNLVKMTSLAFFMSIKEITGSARVAAADSIRYIECYVVIFIIYLILCVIIERVFKLFERGRGAYI